MASFVDSEETQEDFMELILEKLNELCDVQKQQSDELRRQGEQIEDILDRLYEMETKVTLIHTQQVANGTLMGALQQTCMERPLSCRARARGTPAPPTPPVSAAEEV
jgi:hypothetical protein